MWILPGRGLKYVGSLPHLLKLFDRNDEAPSCDHIDHGKDPRQRSRVRKINDSAFQMVCRGQCLRQVVEGRQKDIGNLKTDGVSFVYQWAPLIWRRLSSLRSSTKQIARESPIDGGSDEERRFSAIEVKNATKDGRIYFGEKTSRLDEELF